MTAKAILRTIPWKFALPAIAAVLTLYLIHLDALWSIGAGKWDDLAVMSANGLVRLLNGPVATLLGGLEFRPYFVVGAVFWTWTGYLFDRRLHGIRESTIRRRWVDRCKG